MEIIEINGKEYGLYLRNEERNNPQPHIIDAETLETPYGNQRPILKSFLEANNVSLEPWEKKNTHWCIYEAYKISRKKDGRNKNIKPENPSEIEPESKNQNFQVRKDSYLALTKENIEKEHEAVLKSQNYGKEQEIIEAILKKFPENDDLLSIALKISVIDITNSTQLSRFKGKVSLYALAQIIRDIKDFDERLKNGDAELVEEIAGASPVNLFSFASKYCHYHSVFVYGKDDFSIYDNVVKESLPHYFDIKESQIENWRKNKDYKAFNDFIAKSLDSIPELKDFPQRRTKFDHFLWFANRKRN